MKRRMIRSLILTAAVLLALSLTASALAISPAGTEHDWGPWKVDEKGNCVKPELLVRVCSFCGAKDWKYGAYGDHDWGEWQTVKEPTATEPGLERRICKIESSHVEEREIPPTGGVPVTNQGEAALLVTFTDQSSPLKSVYDLNDGIYFEKTVTNVGSVDLELFDWFSEHSSWDSTAGNTGNAGARTLLRPGESTGMIGGVYLSTAAALSPSRLVPGTETEELAGIAWFAEIYPGYRPGTDEVLCTGTGYIEYKVGKTQAEEKPHGMTVTVTWDEGIGEGKRYEGAVIPLYFTCVNTGETPVCTWLYHSGETTLQPGEAKTYTMEWNVTAGEALEGVVHESGSNIWEWDYKYQDAEGKWVPDSSFSNPVEIPLTYPDGVVPEPEKPELTLNYTYDDPEKEVYDPEDDAFAFYSLVNTGNVPLRVTSHFSSWGVEENDEEGIYDPGDYDLGGWGWHVIKDGITPGTETEDLLGTVTIRYYYIGLDVETGEERCRTQTITRTWKVGKPVDPDDPGDPTPTISRSALSAALVVDPAYVSYDPAGYELGEYFQTRLSVSNTGETAIPAGTIAVYDPSDDSTEKWFPDDFEVDDALSYNWTSGVVTAWDVEQGFIYLPPVRFTWHDPETGEEMVAYSNDLYLPVISHTGLLPRKSVANIPNNGNYFVEGEEIVWGLTLTNNSAEPIRDVTVTDQGETVGQYAQILPGETVTIVLPPYTVTEYDAQVVGYVTNVFQATGSNLRGIPHTYTSNEVWAPAGGITPPPPPPPTITRPDDPPSRHIDPVKKESCRLELTALGDNGADYTLHTCAAHIDAARNAEAAALAGDWRQACAVWSAEIDELYETLLKVSDSQGKAAVEKDREAFSAYVTAFSALRGDEMAADMLRLHCAELCCMAGTAPERLPDSLLNACAHLAAPGAEHCERQIGLLNGSDAEVTERYDEAHAPAFRDVVRLAQSASYGKAQASAFTKAASRWQMALDSVVNAQYKAADKDGRKLIAAERMALDGVYQARKALLELLYPDAPEVVAESLSNLYRSELLYVCGR